MRADINSKTASLRFARRDSASATRPYVIVNELLAKHLPVTPSDALGYFARLGVKIAESCAAERVLAIGFAETATAVGAAVARALPNAIYVHTSRESLDEEDLLADFEEEHSHARNQALYLAPEFRDLSAYDRILFIEDEITTGKTIRNFLKKIAWQGKIAVSALVFNGFDETAFAGYDALFFCLQKTGYVHKLEVSGECNVRLGLPSRRYDDICQNMASKIRSTLDSGDITGRDVLVLGTEEFMYPALCLGRLLEETAKSVVSHSTTRSPLMPQLGVPPLHTRSAFPSVYDETRKTFLYNLAQYDTIIVFTDAEAPQYDGLVQAIRETNCGNIYLIQAQYDGRS